MLDCLLFLKIGRWREETVRDRVYGLGRELFCVSCCYSSSSSSSAVGIEAFPRDLPHGFYYSFYSSSPSSSPLAPSVLWNM